MAANLMCPVEEQYRPPSGYYDLPFIYVYDYENAVAAGADPRAGLDFAFQSVHIEGDSEFILRRVARYSIDSADDFMLYSPDRNRMFSAEMLGATQSIFAVMPERRFPPGGALRFDIFNWASSGTLAFGGQGPFVCHAQVLFQGVRRFQGTFANPRPSKYDYKEKPYSFRFPLGLTTTYLLAPYAGLNRNPDQVFAQKVDNHDFELQRISIVDTTNGNVVTGINSPSFKIMLCNQGRYQLMSDFVYVSAINQIFGGAQTTGQLDRQAAQFPVPPIIYQARSDIEFHVRSFQDDPTGAAPDLANYDIVFGGVQRIPCDSMYGG